ncbi:hypothetical protein [Rhizobium sp. UGM030330-04]|uniref:hypothetical protein n=1 Tax=Rhizobium sp. UGM030330-04 TaxID=1378077 RepID=UPI000DA212B1|nr:hypothetical protein [Rhizobium sp. UGM030330-04]
MAWQDDQISVKNGGNVLRFNRTQSGFERCSEVKTGGIIDCFFSFAFWCGKYWSAHRRHVIFDPDKWPEDTSSYVSDIVLTCWEEDEGGLTQIETWVVGSGNDPRVLVFNGDLIILYRGSLKSEREYYLYSVSRSDLKPVNITTPFFNYGKNWAPYCNGKTIGVVHGFDPLVTLDIDPDTGEGSVVCYKDIPWNARARHDGFAVHRGGSNALRFGDYIVGFGHSTIAPYQHYPFFWSLSDRSELKVSQEEGFVPLVRRGYGIIDPTSLFEGPDSQLYLSICASERDWFYAQKFIETIIPVKFSGSSGHAPTAQIEMDYGAPTTVRRMFACDLQSAVETNIVPYGGREARQQKGYICFGPYLPLETGHYEIKIRYRCSSDVDVVCGQADFCRCIPGHAEQLASAQIMGTNDIISIVKYAVYAEMENGEAFETRVFIDGPSSFTLYDIEIVKV